MKVFLFLNGPEGCQSGIEDGFNNLLVTEKISKLSWFYFEDFHKKNPIQVTLKKMLDLLIDFCPNVIVFFHIGDFPINVKFIRELKSLSSKPLIVYDEGDMYGSWAKPLGINLKNIMKSSDYVSIRGLGPFEKTIKKLNNNVFYTPHHNDIARYMIEPFVDPKQRKDIVLIGNRVKPRFLSFIRRLPGARGRESFVRKMAEFYPNDFKLYGNGWTNFNCNQGPVEFYNQNDYYRNALVTVAYEHYPKIPYYFSNRLPMALMNGSLYVCHEHEGYKNIFPENDFIFFFKNHLEAKLIIDNILKFEEDDYCDRSKRAREFALKHYHPNVVWDNFLSKISFNGL